METKALLYLMNFRDDSDEIYYFVVDFFNDLTGANNRATKLWDVQSKGATSNSPRQVGEALVTLYKNYVEEFTFEYYILFIGGVSSTVRKNSAIDIFGIENISDSAKPHLIDGLKSECKEKSYIDDNLVTNERIHSFLQNITFVVDNKTPSAYVKQILKDCPKLNPSESRLQSIFNEIRDKQSGKKNDQIIEGLVITEPIEAINYFRHLTIKEIKMLVLQRVINSNPLEASTPTSFIDILSKCPEHTRKDCLESCKQSLCQVMFNNNAQQGFWTLFQNIYFMIIDNPKESVLHIYNRIDKEEKDNCPNFDAISLQYFIAKIKDGVTNDN